MHELSIALEVCRQAERYAAPRPAAAVLEIGLEVGSDAGVEVANLQFCLDSLLAQPPFVAARAVIAQPPGDVLRLSYLEVEDGSAAHRGA
jgi:Zn finger protein HypA/HybF involved in hydrogenase expression